MESPMHIPLHMCSLSGGMPIPIATIQPGDTDRHQEILIRKGTSALASKYALLSHILNPSALTNQKENISRWLWINSSSISLHGSLPSLSEAEKWGFLKVHHYTHTNAGLAAARAR